MATLVDPLVSRRKFQREVRSLLKQASELRKRGWLIEATSFPRVRVTFLTTKVRPHVAVLTADLDFSNYDMLPPSIRLLHPITLTPVPAQARRLNPQGGEPQNLVVAAHPDTLEPFLCMPGVREYHSHPQHTGDSWDLHRYSGEGSLYVLLDHISNYCVDNITAFAVPTILINQIALQQEPAL